MLDGRDGATWDCTEGADRANAKGVCLLLLVCSFYSLFRFYHFSPFPIVSFSVKYNSRRAGLDGPMRAEMATPGEWGEAGMSSVTDFLPTLLFSSSHVYYLFCRGLQQQTGRGRVGWDSNAGQHGRQAGGRRREEKVGRRADGEHGDI